jgi:hypothetical protein
VNPEWSLFISPITDTLPVNGSPTTVTVQNVGENEYIMRMHFDSSYTFFIDELRQNEGLLSVIPGSCSCPSGAAGQSSVYTAHILRLYSFEGYLDVS